MAATQTVKNSNTITFGTTLHGFCLRNESIMENYAKELHRVLFNMLAVQNKFKVTISCANWLIRLTTHANSCLDKIKFAI